MIISTKGRYALKLMMYLAQHADGSFIPLKIISTEVNVSLKYLERITTALSKQHLVESASGKGGGYRLSRKPEAYCVGEILSIVQGAPICETADSCQVLPIWKGLSGVINAYLDGITLAEVANWKGEPET